MQRKPFVPTHRLREAIPSLRLKKGTLLRQINPFAGGRWDHLMMMDATDWRDRRKPWLLLSDDVEPLECWPAERQKMIDAIGSRRP